MTLLELLLCSPQIYKTAYFQLLYSFDFSLQCYVTLYYKVMFYVVVVLKVRQISIFIFSTFKSYCTYVKGPGTGPGTQQKLNQFSLPVLVSMYFVPVLRDNLHLQGACNLFKKTIYTSRIQMNNRNFNSLTQQSKKHPKVIYVNCHRGDAGSKTTGVVKDGTNSPEYSSSWKTSSTFGRPDSKSEPRKQKTLLPPQHSPLESFISSGIFQVE